MSMTVFWGTHILACVHMYGEENHCIAECDCFEDSDDMYCYGLYMCSEMKMEEDGTATGDHHHSEHHHHDSTHPE